MNNDNPTLGVSLMLGFCCLAPVADALAKLLGDHFGLAQLVAFRMIFQVICLAPLVLIWRITMRLSYRAFCLAAVRAVLHISGIALIFLSLRYLPLADAIAIAFVMPFIMLLLGHFILGEEVGSRRILACCVGFLGTLLVVQPSFVEVGWPALYPLGVALIFALFMLVTRQLAKEIDPIALQVVSGLQASVILLPLLFYLNGAPGFEILNPEIGFWALAALMGLLGTASHLLATWALRYAPSATLAPMQYLEIPVAAAVGWVMFRDFPNGLALLGIVVTILAGLYIVLRERMLNQET